VTYDVAMPSLPAAQDDTWRTLAEFNLPAQPGNEHLAMDAVASAVRELGLPPARLQRIKTAVAGAVLNAMEHGNGFRPEMLVAIRVLVTGGALAVRASDPDGDGLIPQPLEPGLEAKPAGQEPARGWGFFLIEKMADALRIAGDEAYHTIELFLYPEGET